MADSCVDLRVRRCDCCGAVFHAECRQKAQPCPRCVRRELHHMRPSSFWSPDDDDSPGCFFMPYQDTWDAHRRTEAVTVRVLSDHCAGQSACFLPRLVLDSRTNSATEDDPSILCIIRFGFLLTLTPELSLRPTVKSRDETNCCTRLYRLNNLNVLRSNITHVLPSSSR